MACLDRRVYRFFFMALTSALLAACSGGGGGGGGGSPTGSNTSGGGTTYTVSVVTSGLTGSGLSVGISSDAGMETMSISSDGTRTFSLGLPEGSLYAVGIGAQPSGQVCSIGGQFLDSSISSDATATVTCVDTKTVGGNVTGLTGQLVLDLNGYVSSVTQTADGSFTFDKDLTEGSYYAVSVDTQPDGQLCLVSNSSGQIGTSAITNIDVTCSTAPTSGFKVGGYISGLSGLAVVQLNGGEEIGMTYNGSFSFDTPLPSGTPYTVTLSSVSSGNDCRINNGSGVIADSNYPFVGIECETISTGISPKVDPDGAWLDSGDSMTVTLNGTEDMVLDNWDFNPVAFHTDLNAGDAYAVTMKIPPPGQECTLFNSVGVIEAGVTPMITMNCNSDTSAKYNIGGSITGLNGTGLVLNLDGRVSLPIESVQTSYVFPDPEMTYVTHNVTVESNPAGQICSITNDNPWLTTGDITDVNVICSNGPYSIGGYVSGLSGDGLNLQLNGEEVLSVAAGSSDFSFQTLFSDGMDYRISIVDQPQGQHCTVSNSYGYSITASVTDALVDCAPLDFSVGVNVTGLSSSTPLSLSLNGTEIMDVTQNTWYSGSDAKPFETLLRDGESYSVTIAMQPEGQFCYLTNSSGVISGADISDIGVVCADDTSGTATNFTVGVTTSGLLGSGLTLQLNDGNDLNINADGYLTFGTALPDLTPYTVSIVSKPTGPLQECKVTNSSGTINSANVTNVGIQCGSPVHSLYPTNGGKWLDYVKNDGPSIITATDTACDPAVDTGGYDVCLNGGEFMTVAVPYLANCDGVTASDNLNAFDWVCDDSAGVRVISTGLKDSAGLTDLVDFYEVAFKPNFLVINSSSYTDQTQPAIWWSNPVLVNNNGDYFSSGEIHLVTGTTPFSYSMYDHSALLVKPGYVINGMVEDKDDGYSHDFLWFEGSIDSSDSYGLVWGTEFSMARNVVVQNSASAGVYIIGYNDKLHNVTSSNNTGIGVKLRGDYLNADNITANGNLGDSGIETYTYGNSLTLANLTANNNINGSGIVMAGGGNVALTNATANGNGTAAVDPTYGHSGIVYSGGTTNYTNNTFINLVAAGNKRYGVDVSDTAMSSIAGVNVKNNGVYGLNIYSSESTTLKDITAIGNGDTGIHLQYYKFSKVSGLVAANNSGTAGIHLDYSDGVLVSDVISSNNSGSGYIVSQSTGVTSDNITAVNNVDVGVDISSLNSSLTAATSINNGGDGFVLDTMYGHLSSLMSVNNGGNGLNYDGGAWNNNNNLISTNNSGYGISYASDEDYFGGQLYVGNNGSGDCYLPLSASYYTLPGLIQGGNYPNKPTTDCVVNPDSTSDAVLVAGIDASSTLIGKVTIDDSVNIDDASGGAQFDYINDWSGFENPYRSWGVDGTLAFADAGNQGACDTLGENCRIWDVSVSISDAANSGAPIAYNVVPLPTVSDFTQKDWGTSIAREQAYCDVNYPGSTWDGSSRCISEYLQSARELSDDSIGNDNQLCEKGETCLYMPNIGSYQGHGNLIDAGTVGTGADTITLKKYESLGR